MSFDLLAPHYRWLEAMLAGRRLQRCRTAWIEELGACREVLIAGVGRGHCLRQYALRFPHLRITALDASERMLAYAEKTAAAAGVSCKQVRFVHASLPDWPLPAASFDAIVTPFFLDCFAAEELGQVVFLLARAARHRARWLVADFTIPEHGVRRLRARAVHALMYAFFRPVAGIRARRVTAPDAFLARHGFSLYGRKISEWGLLHSDLWMRE